MNASAEPRVSMALHAALPDLPPAPADGAAPQPLRAEVIPAPNAKGIVPTRGGPVHRVPDPQRLAAELNAQAVAARVDFDHETEPISKTYRKSSEARGWLSSYRATVAGAIEALIELSAEALDAIRQKKYRYLSPAVMLDPRGNIRALSSVALVNNPNMPLGAPAVNAELNSEGSMDENDLNKREQQIKAREEAYEQRMNAAATKAVDQAIEERRLLPAQKEFVLNSILNHKEGVEAGLNAFETAYPSSHVAPTLEKRVGPTGFPPSRQSGQSGFVVPSGYTVDDAGMQLHGQVAEHARKRGISYRDAVMEMGALGAV